MKTLNLKEVALFLQMPPEALRVKAANGEIPGAKPSKRGVFARMILPNTYARSMLRMLNHRGVSEMPKGGIYGTLQKRKHMVD